MLRIIFFYLASFGSSLLGNSITAIALPLLVLMTTGSPLGAGAVAIAAAVPSIAGLLMGSVIDRINRRTAAILSDVISAVAVLILPIIDLTIGLNLGWFIAVAILNSFGDVPGITARESMLPAIAKAARMDPSRVIGLRESVGGVSLLVGPAVAGLLVATLAPVTVLWVTSGIAGLAALLTFGIPRRASVMPSEPDDPTTTKQSGSFLAGLAIIFRTPVLRAMVFLSLASAVALAATQGMVIPVHFAFQDQAQFVGFVLSALAVGLLIGGGLFATLGEKISRRVWLASGLVVLTLGFITIGILGPVWSIFLGAAIVGLGGGCMNSVAGLTFVENVADSQRGKVLGAQNALMTLVPALGVGGAALLIELGSLRFTMAVMTLLWVVAAVASMLSLGVRQIGRKEE
jgi:MFS family permease